MRLVKADVANIVFEDGSTRQELQIAAKDNGVRYLLATSLPLDWSALGRAQKTQWVKDWLVVHSETHSYVSGTDAVFPDPLIQEQAFTNFGNFANWATWTAQEAVNWIDVNVTDLISAKVVLSQMARAIVYLRDIAIRRI